MSKSFLGRNDLPRGLRNNNPGNLVITNIDWKGKLPVNQNTDGRFEQFVSIAYGIRAMILDVISDITKKGLNTIARLINEYAPGHENDTHAYIRSVESNTGIAANEIIIPTRGNVKKLIRAIIAHENGTWPASLVTDKDFEEAMDMASIEWAKAAGMGLGMIAILAGIGYLIFKK